MLRSLALLVALLAFAPAAQAATTYYAAPLTANTTTCDVATPCTLVAAIAKTAIGDTVQLAPGDYHRGGGSGSPLEITHGITLMGQPGAQRPRILQEDPYTSCSCAIVDSNGATTFRHLMLDQSVDTASPGGINLTGGDVVDDVLAIGGRQGGYAVPGTGTIEIHGSVFVGGMVGLDLETTTHLEHVTVIGTGASAIGLSAARWISGTTGVTIDNSIMQGGSSGHDVLANTHDPSAAVVVTGHYSAIARSAGDTSGAGAEQFDLSDHVLAADPVFTSGGYGVTGASPTIDAASAALTHVPLDFDGLPRILGSAPDMGAFEYAPAPDVAASATDVAQTTANLSGSVTTVLAGDAHFEYGVDSTYGSIAGASPLPGATSAAAVGAALAGLAPGTTYHYRLVASNAHGTTATPDATFTTTAGPPPPFTDTTPPHLTKLTLRWPRLRFVLDEPARVTFKIGKRSWSRRLPAGASTIKVPQRIRRALKPGRHKLRIVAVDVAGNRSAALTKRFRTRR